MKLVVVGDVLLELVADLPYSFQEIHEDTLTRVPISCVVGGTAANLALAATEHFQEVVIGGCVGDDPFGTFVTATLEEAGVRCLFRRAPNAPTGMAIYQRDGSSSADKGVRHLVVAEPSANSAFTLADVERLRADLVAADVVVTDGYAVQDERRRAAVLACMAVAKGAGVQVAFDIVPHDCFTTTQLDQVCQFVQDATAVIVEVRTLLALLGQPFLAIARADDARRAAVACRRLWPDKFVYLRYGIGNAEEVLLVSPAADPAYYNTGYADAAEPRGFGDRLTAADLARLAGGRLVP